MGASEINVHTLSDSSSEDQRGDRSCLRNMRDSVTASLGEENVVTSHVSGTRPIQ